jgi:hypothetical protein
MIDAASGMGLIYLAMHRHEYTRRIHCAICELLRCRFGKIRRQYAPVEVGLDPAA